MPFKFRRYGVPTKPRETEFVTKLIEATKQPGFVRHRRFSDPSSLTPAVPVPAQLEIDARNAQQAAIGAAEDAGLRAMSDVEFAAFLESEGLTPDSIIAISYAQVRRS